MSRFSKFIFIVLMVNFSIVLSQNIEKISILDIKVNGNIRISDEDILRSARLWPGKEIDIEDIQNSIKYLWKLGRFSDIQIFVEEESINGIKLIFDVKESPILNNVIFKGNKKLSKNTLEEKISLQTGQILSEESLKRCWIETGKDPYTRNDIKLEKLKRGRYYSSSLGVVSGAYGISIDNWHSALADVEMMMKMFHVMQEHTGCWSIYRAIC